MLIGERMILLVNYVGLGYCILRYIFGLVFFDDLYEFYSNFSICFLSFKFVDKCLILILRNVKLEGLVIVDDLEKIVCVFFVFGWLFVVKKWIIRYWRRYWFVKEMMDKVIVDGCYCVFVGNLVLIIKYLEW